MPARCSAPARSRSRTPSVRLALLKELGVQNDYDPVITSDIDGPEAKARKIDERLAKETPALSSVQPATRLATAILMYSFGGLRRDGKDGSETLPPGVTESELLAAVVGPDLDNITATAVLAELRNACLYLHHDGVRYAFKKDPNVTKLIEDAESEVARDPEAVRTRVREMLTKRLAGQSTAIIWPEKSQGIDDKEPRFLVAYLPLEFAAESKADQTLKARELVSKYGDRPRSYRNGIALAIPEKNQLEPLRRAVRYLMAIERVEGKKEQLRLTKDQTSQLSERRKTEEAAAESAFRSLYSSVWLPRVEEGGIGIEAVESGGRPLQATGIHQRIMELLTSIGTPKVHSKLTPQKIVDRLKLGDAPSPQEPPRLGVRTSEVQDAFFSFLSPPRLDSADVIRKAIVQGVSQSIFGYTSGAVPTLGPDGKYQIARERVALGRAISEDEVDFDSGFLIMPTAIPEAKQPDGPTLPGEVTPPPGDDEPIVTPPPGGGPVIVTTPPKGAKPKTVQLKFSVNRDQLFKIFPAVANLSDHSDGGKVTIQVTANSGPGFDPSWLRNAVEEPFDEAGIEKSAD